MNGISSASWLSTFVTTMKIERTWVLRRTRPQVGRPPSVQQRPRFDPSRDSVACTIVTRSRLKASKSCLPAHVRICRQSGNQLPACVLSSFPTRIMAKRLVESRIKAVRVHESMAPRGVYACAGSFDEAQLVASRKCDAAGCRRRTTGNSAGTSWALVF